MEQPTKRFVISIPPWVFVLLNFFFGSNLWVCEMWWNGAPKRKIHKTFSFHQFNFELRTTRCRLYLNQCPKINIYIWNRYVYIGDIHMYTNFLFCTRTSWREGAGPSCYIFETSKWNFSAFSFSKSSIAYHQVLLAKVHAMAQL